LALPLPVEVYLALNADGTTGSTVGCDA